MRRTSGVDDSETDHGLLGLLTLFDTLTKLGERVEIDDIGKGKLHLESSSIVGLLVIFFESDNELGLV